MNCIIQTNLTSFCCCIKYNLHFCCYFVFHKKGKCSRTTSLDLLSGYLLYKWTLFKVLTTLLQLLVSSSSLDNLFSVFASRLTAFEQLFRSSALLPFQGTVTSQVPSNQTFHGLTVDITFSSCLLISCLPFIAEFSISQNPLNSLPVLWSILLFYWQVKPSIFRAFPNCCSYFQYMSIQLVQVLLLIFLNFLSHLLLKNVTLNNLYQLTYQHIEIKNPLVHFIIKSIFDKK